MRFWAHADGACVRVGQNKGEDERRKELLQVQGRRWGETGICNIFFKGKTL